MKTYTKSGSNLVKGPCVVCGLTDYPLSMGGANICPSCDCGIELSDPRHMRNQLDAAQPLPLPVLMPASRDALILAALEACLRELQTLNTQVAQIQMVVAPRQGYEGQQKPQS